MRRVPKGVKAGDSNPSPPWKILTNYVGLYVMLFFCCSNNSPDKNKRFSSCKSFHCCYFVHVVLLYCMILQLCPCTYSDAAAAVCLLLHCMYVCLYDWSNQGLIPFILCVLQVVHSCRSWNPLHNCWLLDKHPGHCVWFDLLTPQKSWSP